MPNRSPGKKRWQKASAWGAAAAATVFAVQLAGLAPALANAANPNPDTTATAHVNKDGSVTVNVKGTWSWPGQSCEGRYAEGWAVDWWGISSSPTPANPFSLTNATEVTSPTTTTTGTISPAGSIPIGGKPGPGPGGGASSYFHVAQYYAGQDINSASTCTDTGTGKNAGSTGSWSASATYPNKADLPPQICAIMYDEHGSEGKTSGNANDLSPTKDHDNSIQTNAFDPTQGKGYCVTPTFPKPPPPPKKHGYLEICKDASGSGLSGDVFTFLVQGKKHTVPVGACSAAFQVTAGNVTVKEVATAGSKLVGVSTIPANRLVSDNLASRTAVVKVVPGNVSTQTIVTFTNKKVPGSGYLKVCAVAGSGVAQMTNITFTVGSATVTVPAGPASSGGYCAVVGKFAFGSQTVQENIPSGDQVTKIVAAPSNRLLSSDTSTGTASVEISSGVTEVTFTTAASSS